MALKSLLARAAAAGKKLHQKGQQHGWSDGWHSQVSTTESLREIRDSAAGVAKSTAQTATTQEGWRRIARGAGKMVGGAAVVAGRVAQGLSASMDNEASQESSPNLNDDGYGTAYDQDGDWMY